MTTIEDRVRAAATAAADTVAPGSAPPLRLPAEPGRRGGRRHRRGRERWIRRIAPLAAAAAVIAVVAASLALASGAPGHRPPASAANGAALAGLPPYYVMLTGNNPDPAVLQPLHAVIRATATGATVSTITAPSPYSTFIKVAGAGDGRAFVLAAEKLVVGHVPGGVSQKSAPVKFFMLHIAASGRASLTALPIPPEPASAGPAGIALSPDGRKLAVAVNGGRNPRIQVFSTATGSEHDWTWPGGGRLTNNAGGRTGQVLSWSADDRTVAFQLWKGPDIYIGLADTASSQSGRLVITFAGGAVNSSQGYDEPNGASALITPGAAAGVVSASAAIVCATTYPAIGAQGPLPWHVLGIVEYSARNGLKLEMMAPGGNFRKASPPRTEDVLWTNATGTRLIVVGEVRGTKPGTYQRQIGVTSAGRFTPLPGPQLASELSSYPAW